MKTVCAFCNITISPGTSPDEPVSHGICTSCYNQILARHGFNIRKFLDMLDAPVFLVDNDVNILAANTLAIAITKKPVAEVREPSVETCWNASTPTSPEDAGKLQSVPTALSGRPSARPMKPDIR